MGAAWLNFLAGEMLAELENIENKSNPNENNNGNPNENNENNNKKHQDDKQRKEPGRMRKNAANSNINEIFEDKDLGNAGKHSKGYEETLEGRHLIKMKKSTTFGEIKDGLSENTNTCSDKMWISCRGILF